MSALEIVVDRDERAKETIVATAADTRMSFPRPSFERIIRIPLIPYNPETVKESTNNPPAASLPAVVSKNHDDDYCFNINRIVTLSSCSSGLGI